MWIFHPGQLTLKRENRHIILLGACKTAMNGVPVSPSRGRYTCSHLQSRLQGGSEGGDEGQCRLTLMGDVIYKGWGESREKFDFFPCNVSAALRLGMVAYDT